MFINLLVSVVVVVLGQLLVDWIRNELAVRKWKRDLVIAAPKRAKRSEWRVGR